MNPEERSPSTDISSLENSSTAEVVSTSTIQAQGLSIHMYVIIPICIVVLLGLLALTYSVYSLKTESDTVANMATFENELYKLGYPATWTAYEVDGTDNELDGVLILSPEAVAVAALSTSSPVESMQEYRLLKELDESGFSYIKMQGAYSYSNYVPLEERTQFFNYMLEESADSISQQFNTVEIAGTQQEPYLYTKSIKQGRVVESITWFATPDPYGRDKGGVAILVSLEYSAGVDAHNPALFDQVQDSSSDKVIAHILRDTPISETVDTPVNQLDLNTLFSTASTSILGVVMSRSAEYVLLAEHVGYVSEGFETVLQILDTNSDTLQPINLEPFNSELELNIFDYRDQQIFSPDGTKVVFAADVGKASPDTEYAGFTGFAVFDLVSNGIDTLLPTVEYEYISSFKTSNGISSGYDNLYGWVNDSEVMYTCKRDSDETETFVSLDEVDYCVIDIETKEVRIVGEWNVQRTSYSSDQKDVGPTLLFYSKNSDCADDLLAGHCLRISDGVVTLERGDKRFKITEGASSSFYGWQQDGVYLVVNESTWKGSESKLIKFPYLTN